ncbi:MAG TPA: TonB-dependent receptor, partial [Flavobacteriaceae bacterium]|nr:TonB-dependent receptor [Flavobacteriaceae bacterium]
MYCSGLFGFSFRKYNLTMKTLFFTFMLCVSASLFAHDLNGTVVNQDNERLEDVYVFNQRTSTAVYTDHNGNFKLEDVELGDIIMLSYIGFKNYTLTITE